MKTYFNWLLFFCMACSSRAQSNSVTESTDEKVCYDWVGCYSQNPPWVLELRPFPPPRSPEEIAVRFFLLTRNSGDANPISSYQVGLNPDYEPKLTSLRPLDYKPRRFMTIFIVHGLFSSVESEWMVEMAQAFLYRLDVNVFLVDWERGAGSANYLQVAANTRVVGTILTKFILTLIQRTGLIPQMIHLVGHSLGAHICAYAGKNIPFIYRITGLDVAQPGFEGSSPEVRLNKTDAFHVDVLHTNAKPTIPLFGFGYVKPLGDVDFYFNNGFYQPGCVLESLLQMGSYLPITSPEDVLRLPIETVEPWVSCSHSKAIEYFIEAIRQTDCVMWGRKVPKEIFLSIGLLGTLPSFLPFSRSVCDLNTCSPVGLETFIYPARGIFQVTTALTEPYCVMEESNNRRMAQQLVEYRQGIRSG